MADGQTEKFNKICFYSASMPMKISSYNEIMAQTCQGSVQLQKSCKGLYELQILYYQPKKNSGGGLDNMVLRKRRIIIGKAPKTQTQQSSNDDEAHQDKLRKTLAKKGRFFIVDSPNFSPELYQKSGGFLNAKFWYYNLLHKSADLYENFKQVTQLLQNDLQFNVIQVNYEGEENGFDVRGKLSLEKLMKANGYEKQKTSKKTAKVVEDSAVPQ